MAATISVLLSLFAISASEFSVLFAVIVAFLLLSVAIFVKKFRETAAIFAVAVIVLLNAFGIIKLKIDKIPNQGDAFITASGTITAAEYKDGRAFYILETDSQNSQLPKGININVYSRFVALDAGDKVKCNLYVSPITQNKGSFYAKGIYAKANIAKVLSVESGIGADYYLAKLRKTISNKLFDNLSNESAATVNALTVGDRYYQTNTFNELIRRSGVSHVMVVSGMHMAILCGSVLKALIKLKMNKRIAALTTAVIVFLFMALCGFTMSVMRAGITYFILLLSVFLFKRADPLNSLCVAVCIIIMINPFAVGSAAFVLSVSSTAGIIVLANPMAEYIADFLKIKNKWILAVINALAVTLSAMFATFPFTVFYFGTVSIIAPLTNLLINYAVTAALILASIALPLSFISVFNVIAKGIFFFVDILTMGFSFIIEWLGSSPYAEITVDRFVAIICYLAIILGLSIIKYIEQIWKVVASSAGSIRANAKKQYRKRQRVKHIFHFWK